MKSLQTILDALAAQQQRGGTSLTVTIEPGLIPEATKALRGYRTLFAPVIPGVTDLAPIHAIYEEMRQEDAAKHSILLLVDCQTLDQFRDAISQMPLRHSSEWRAISA